MIYVEGSPAPLQNALVTYFCDLDTPIEQVLGTDIVLMLTDVVQEAAIGHELCDELNGGGQADAQQAAHMGVVHTGHDIGLLWERAEDIPIRLLMGVFPKSRGKNVS